MAAMPDTVTEPGVPVELNIYDLLHPDNPDALPTLNSYLYSVGMGLYHSGVSVYGREYCYGGHPHPSTGVFAVTPKCAPDARYRQTLLVGRTHLSPQQVRELIQDFSDVWSGASYNLLTRNCNHFASDLCERLTGKPAPEWVNRLAWIAEKAKFLLPEGFDTPTAAPVQDPQLHESMRPDHDEDPVRRQVTGLPRHGAGSEEEEQHRDPDHDR